MQSDEEHSLRSVSNYVVQQMSRRVKALSNVCLLYVMSDAINPSFLKQIVVWAGQGGRSCSSNPTLFGVGLFPYVSAGMLNKVCMVQKLAYYLKYITYWLVWSSVVASISWWILFVCFFGFALIHNNLVVC